MDDEDDEEEEEAKEDPKEPDPTESEQIRSDTQRQGGDVQGAKDMLPYLTILTMWGGMSSARHVDPSQCWLDSFFTSSLTGKQEVFQVLVLILWRSINWRSK